MSKPTRVYQNSEVTVEWRAELCTHCRACVNGLPKVFDLDKKPWVNLDGASAAEIRAQVGKCPSNALSLGGAK